jgi:environmental stress-induced protein Ves
LVHSDDRLIVQRAASRTAMPWRNGKGVQYEITADGPLPDGWTWRVSTADISQDVPFSVYEGVSRDFCVAEGDGVVLTIDGTAHRCATHSVTSFAGDATVSAALIDGPVRALNLMRVVGGPGGTWRIVRAGESATVDHVAVALAGGVSIEIASGTYELQTLDALLTRATERVRVIAGCVAVF